MYVFNNILTLIRQAGINNTCDVKTLACRSSTTSLLIKVGSTVSAAVVAIDICVVAVVVIGCHIVERAIVVISIVYTTSI